MIRDLDAIISEGEGYKVDFKESPSKDLITEVCAFANASGGRIFIGIDDHGNIVGTDTSNVERSRIQDTINKMEPHLNTKIEVHDNIIVITVPEGKEKPYYCSQGFFLRIGPNSQKLYRDDIIEFLQSENIIRFDTRVRNELPVGDNFNEKAYRSFITKAKISEIIPFASILSNLDCAKLNDDGELVYTNTGALFFRDNTEDSFFIHAKVVCAIFKGKHKAIILDAKEYNGGMLENIDDAMAFLRRNLRLRYETEWIQRKEILEIPEDALREAIINAVCHRDYFQYGANVMIEIYDDRVEISSPGGLPKGMTESELGVKSIPRNPAIANMLHRAGYIEKMGTGIKKMGSAMMNAGLESPAFTVTSFFTAVFRRPALYAANADEKTNTSFRPPNGLSENEADVYMAIAEDRYTTAKDLATSIGMSARTIERVIVKLRENGSIRREGNNRKGKWELVARTTDEEI